MSNATEEPNNFEFNWITESSRGHFLPLSFKFGLVMGVQLAVLYNQRSALFRNGFVGKIPFFLQVSWLISNIAWNISFVLPEDSMSFGLAIVANIGDLITKILVMYFVCYRMIILKNIQNKIFTILWRILIGLGLILCILVLLPEFIKDSVSEETYDFLQIFYPIADAYISIIDIVSLISYMVIKFDCKSVQSFQELIIANGLVVDCFAIVASTIVSFTLMILKFSTEYDIDYDLNFVLLVASIKYASSCNAAIAVFQKTINNSAKKTAPLRKSAGPNPSLSESRKSTTPQ